MIVLLSLYFWFALVGASCKTFAWTAQVGDSIEEAIDALGVKINTFQRLDLDTVDRVSTSEK